MQNIQQIENWIEAIESSNLSEKEQEQRITALVDLWKFASCHSSSLKMGEMPNLLLQEKDGIFETINVQCENLYINKQENSTKKMFAEIESELHQNAQKYAGIYRLQMNKMSANFNEETIQEVKQEIIAAIKGEVVLFKHVLNIYKTPSSDIQLVGLNFTILECTQNMLQEKIKNLNFKQSLFLPGEKWLVFFLNTLENDCNYFSFDQTLKDKHVMSDFDRVFLFDFYKGEVLEVETKKSKLKVKILVDQNHRQVN